MRYCGVMFKASNRRWLTWQGVNELPLPVVPVQPSWLKVNQVNSNESIYDDCRHRVTSHQRRYRILYTAFYFVPFYVIIMTKCSLICHIVHLRSYVTLSCRHVTELISISLNDDNAYSRWWRLRNWSCVQCWNWPKRTGGSAAKMFEILPRDLKPFSLKNERL